MSIHLRATAARQRPHVRLQVVYGTVAVLLASVLSAAASGDTLAGSRPVALSPVRVVASYPRVAMDHVGAATAVWAELLSGGNAILSSSRAPGAAAWSKATVLSATGANADYPEIAVDANGGVVVLWESMPANQMSSIQAAFRAPASGWSKPDTLSSPDTYGEQPVVGIDGKGDAIAVWLALATHERMTYIDMATRSATTGLWSKPSQLASSSEFLLDPQVSITAAGRVVIVWKRWQTGSVLGASGSSGVITAAVGTIGARRWVTRTLGRYVEPTGQGSASFELPGPHVASDAGGDATVVWQAGSVQDVVVEAASWDARTSRWGPAQPVSTRTGGVWPQIASDSRGDLAVTWMGSDGRNIIVSTRQSGTRSWSKPRTLTPAGQQVVEPFVTQSDAGDTIVSWSATASGLEVAVRPANGTWQPPVRFGYGNGGAVAPPAIDAHGQAVLVWAQPSNSPPLSTVIDASSFSVP